LVKNSYFYVTPRGNFFFTTCDQYFLLKKDTLILKYHFIWTSKILFQNTCSKIISFQNGCSEMKCSTLYVSYWKFLLHLINKYFSIFYHWKVISYFSTSVEKWLFQLECRNSYFLYEFFSLYFSARVEKVSPHESKTSVGNFNKCW
jgi:hypothetical protein